MVILLEDVINITMKLCQRVYYVDIPLRYFTVEAMNVDPDDTRRVTVEMFDWSSGSPVLLPLIDPSTQTLPPNRYVTFRSALFLQHFCL